MSRSHFLHFCVVYVGGGGGINFCGNWIANFEPFHIGPALAFNLTKYKTRTKTREKIDFLLNNKFIPANQPVMCSFGEIDCRVHVIKYSKKFNGDFRPVIDNILANYLDFMKFLAREHPVYIWGVVPSQKDNAPINPAFPHYGTEIERNVATKYFNSRLNEICIEHGFEYISIFEYLLDENYHTRSEYFADGCHLSQRAWTFAANEFMKHGINIMFGHEWLENFDLCEIPIKKNLSRPGIMKKKFLEAKHFMKRVRALLRGKVFGDI